MTMQIQEVFWNAVCSCGWRTVSPNDIDTVVNKVSLHLKQTHERTTASVSLTSYLETRPHGVLPALGKLASAPPGVYVSPQAPPNGVGASVTPQASGSGAEGLT